RHNVALRQLATKRKRCQKGSNRSRKLQAARRNGSASKRQQIRDLRHKSTWQIIAFYQQQGASSLFIGNADGVCKKSGGRHHDQRVSQWEYSQDLSYLIYKAQLAHIESFTRSERGPAASVRHPGGNKSPRARPAVSASSCSFVGSGTWWAV